MILGIAALILLSFSLVTAQKSAVTSERTVERIPADKIVRVTPPPASGAKDYCYLDYTDWNLMYYRSDWKLGDKVALYFDPEDCGYTQNYPFQLTDVHLMFFDFAAVGSVTVRFSVEVTCPDICDGPGIEIWKSQPYHITTFYPNEVEIWFEDTVCLDKPFFFNVEYLSDFPGLPSLMFDTQVVDTCYQWFWLGQPSWIEHYEFWPLMDPPVGWALLGISGYVADQAHCGWWYWKPDTLPQAPSGMPDFDQNQRDWVAYCGPTAVANCLWWFDAVPTAGMDPADFIELLAGYFSTTASGTYVDSIQLGLEEYFNDYGFALTETTYWEPDFYEMEDSLKKCQDIILLLGFWWYEEGTEQEFIRGDINASGSVDLADYVNCTNGPPYMCDDAADVNDDGVLNTLDCDYLLSYIQGGPAPPPPYPDCGVDPTADALDCADFPPCPGGSPGEWWREGGHFVTMAGVNSEKKEIAISDPDRDQKVRYSWWPGRVRMADHLPWGLYDGTYHNDPQYVSHDVYISLLYPEFPSPGSDIWDLADYCYGQTFPAVNVPHRFEAYSKVAPKHFEYFHTEVEAAIMICPKPPPDTLRNHFKTWRIEPEPYTQIVFVEDQFMLDTLFLESIEFFSNPAQKDSFEIVDEFEHLTWYRARGRNTLLEVEYTNQFGTYTNTIDSVKYLLLPTAKEVPNPFPENLDHYKAYRIKDPVSFDRQLVLEDQFDIMYGVTESIVTLKPTYFLTPALKNMPPPMFDSITHYVAYEIFPQHYYGLIQVQTFDQFGEHFLQVDTSKFLLVPTKKLRAEPPPNDPPEIGQPDFLEGYVDNIVQYDITGSDPDGDVILDDASIDIQPGCGSWDIVRTSGHGTSTGIWQVTWHTDGCTPCDTHMVIHDLTDETGLVGYCTTWVHLSEYPWVDHKMHYPQLPDLEGWDVFALDPKTLADDWQCSETGWVTDIHFWGSWKDLDGDPYTDDFYTPMPWFRLSIHRNIPASADTPWSRPGEQVWFWEGEIPGTPFEPPAMEHWFNPNTGEVVYNDHVPYWRYDFLVEQVSPPADSFFQYQDSIYWLNVSAVHIDTPYQWGWKSSRDHFMDDAVYTDTPPDGPWYPLFEPPRANWFDVYFGPDSIPEDQGSTNYYGNGWYRYEYWWNMWFYDNPFVPNPKHIWLEFYVDQMYPHSWATFAINWSTDLWATEGVPGRPPLPGEDETLYIGRQIFEVFPGNNTIDFWIDDYNPEWVSIDFVAQDVMISGWIWHECVQTSMDLAFVITGHPAPPNNPPEIGQPDFLEAYVDDIVQYDITGSDPDGDVILDDASIDIQPGCGSGYSITRTSGHGTSTGTWQVTWYTDGCAVCDTHMVIHDLTDEYGLTGYCTTYVHLGEWVDSLWYWKPDTTGAPSGMPDFDQNQDAWVAYCGPTAVANCLWWYGAVPAGWDPVTLIDSLAYRFGTTPGGTDVYMMQQGLEQYFEDFGFAFQESTFEMPDFYEMEDSLKRCQDIILLLGFWFWDEYSGQWYREGGHFVTMAGVCSESLKIAISDPDADRAETGWPGRVRPLIHPPHPGDPLLHNNPLYVSHDMYNSILDSPFPSPGNPFWEIDYPWGMKPGRFAGFNVPEKFQSVTRPAPEGEKQIFATEVEYAVMICPKAEEPRECDDNDPKECDTLWVECGNMLVPPGGGLVTIDMTIANDESLMAIQVPLSYQGDPVCCDSMPENENTLAKVFAGSRVESWSLKVISFDHAAKKVAVAATILPGIDQPLNPGKGHFATLTLLGDSCCTIQTDTTVWSGSIHVGFVDANDPSQTLFYPVVRIDTCHIDRNYPPVIGQPDFLEGYVDDVVIYTITGNDPDGDVIEDEASIDIQPGCGSGHFITRISGHGTSSGTWEIRWFTDGCAPCDTHMVIHDLTDANGFTSYCTTWVHLSESWPNHKMHYPQLPDPEGWDVVASEPIVLADDFMCTKSGRITDIHLWGSWWMDLENPIDGFLLSIHENIPGPPYSQPGELLWEAFIPDYEVTPEEPGMQGWYDPAQPFWEYPDHQMYFRYDITDIPEPFCQDSGTIYWLNVMAIGPMMWPEPPLWGWKTSRLHYEDDAVWAFYTPPANQWFPLTDPITGETLDLSFVITGEDVLCGDVNHSGAVEAGDVVYLISYLYKNGPPPCPLSQGDVNCNGTVDAGDVVYLIDRRRVIPTTTAYQIADLAS
jgi:hypothetical protein